MCEYVHERLMLDVWESHEAVNVHHLTLMEGTYCLEV